MNVLIAIHSLQGGGAERVTVNMAGYWISHGDDVTILTLDGQEGDFYVPHPRVRRICLNLAGQSDGLFTALGANVRRLNAMRRAIRDVQPDFVIGMMASTSVLAILAAKGLPCRVIVSERIHPPKSLEGTIWQELRRWVYSRADAVVALTGESAGWLKRNTKARRIRVIPNPVSLPIPEQPNRVSPESIINPERKILLAVGRLLPQKGFDLLVDAFAEQAISRPHWDLIILGDGPERNSLEAKIASCGLSGRVILPGRVGNIGEWYKRAELYVMSSRFEGFPNTLLEAMASGCPVVSFDCKTGPRDIVRDKIDGLLASSEDISALSTIMGRLMDDEETRKKMASRAVEVLDRFSYERIGTIWRNLLHEVSGSPI